MAVQAEIRPSRAVEAIFKGLGYSPTPSQKVIVYCDKRFILVSGGIQSGKSFTLSHYALRKEIERDDSEGPGLYWLVAADYERTRREFNYLVGMYSRLGRLKEQSKRIDPGYIELVDGTRYETKSAKDSKTLAMYSPDGIIACEASQLDLETYWKLEERVAASGGWVAMGGTMEGSLGWYPALLESWKLGIGDSQSFALDSRDNFHLFPGGYDDPRVLRLRATMPEDWFAERVMGIARPPKGRVFPEFQPEYHVREVPFDPNKPVHVWIDPGFESAYAIEAAQIEDGNVHIFDEIYHRGLITEDMIDLAQNKPWWQNVTVPGAIDVSARRHNSQSSVSEEWMSKASLHLQAGDPRSPTHNASIPIDEGITRMKSFLKPNPLTKEAKLTIAPHCTGVLSELGFCVDPFDGQRRVYSWKTDREGNVVGTTPDDKFNHACKAITYGLVAEFGFVTYTGREIIPVKRHGRPERSRARAR